jgi:hypothetical protein
VTDPDPAKAADTSFFDPDEVRALWRSVGTVGDTSAAAMRDRIKARGVIPAGSGSLTKSRLHDFAVGDAELENLVLRELRVVLIEVQNERAGNVVRFPAEGARKTAKDRAGGGERGKEAAGGEKAAGKAPGAADDTPLAGLHARAKAIAAGDTASASAIIKDAAMLGLNKLEKDRLLGAVKTALGKEYRKVSLEDELKRVESALKLSPEQIAAAAADTKAIQRAADEARLWPLVEKLAKDPRLLERMIDMVTALGVVRERRAIMAVYLAATSRLNRRKCLSVLRPGAPASGKNYLVEMVLKLMPRESIFIVSGGSPKSLIYSGDGDVDFLKHKIVYLPEAAATLAVKNGVEGEFTAAMRTLVSEGYIHYHTVTPQQDGGPPKGHEIIRNGPIAVVVTSARNDLEPEMQTRLLIAESDESQEQTSRVMTSILSTAAGKQATARPADAEIEEAINFQRWLNASGPYSVVIPFGPAIRAAFMLTPDATPKAVRIRRDIDSLIAAVEASAILHNAQRQTDSEGRIVAALDDYKHAFEAFNPGLTSIYRPQVAPGVIALASVLEPMIEAERQRIEALWAEELRRDPNAVRPSHLKHDGGARATNSQLISALGIASYTTVNARIKAALTAGVIEITNPEAPARVGNRYRVLIDSDTLRAAGGVPVFPTPAMVEEMWADPAATADALAAIAAEEAAAAQGPPPPQPQPQPTAPSQPQTSQTSQTAPDVDENGNELV